MKFSIIFPGQGSQSVGMLGQLAKRHEIVRETFEEVSGYLGYDLWRLVTEGPAEQLNKTLYTQPAMFASGLAVWRCWRLAKGPDPASVAGHSLGEFTALVCAGVLSFTDAIALVKLRAHLMQSAVPIGAGAMVAILGLPGKQVEALCRTHANGKVLEPANYNAPMQTVIAGHTEAVERAVEAAREAGARRTVRLPVSVPSHCSLMEDAARQLTARLEDVPLGVAAFPVLHNVDATPHSDVAGLRAALAAQLYRPVRWLDTIRGLMRQGVGLLLEFGPGRVLTGLNRQITEGIRLQAISTPADLEKALEEAWQ